MKVEELRFQALYTVHSKGTLHPGSESYNQFEIMLSGVGSTYTRSVMNKIYEICEMAMDLR